MTFQYRYRKQIIIGLFLFVVFLIVLFFVMKNVFLKKEEPVVEKVSLKKVEEEKEIDYLKVDIKGEIQLPGIYSLEVGSRVKDVIDIAGGLTENADTTVLNLSKKVVDEMVIIVYSHEQVEHFKETKEIEKQVIQECQKGIDESIRNDACMDDQFNNSSQGLININTASLDVLKSLPGIGDAKAEDIIKYREENGGFKSIEEIMNVNGIGESIYSQIKEIITV